MAKGSGTTRSVGSSVAASGRTFNTGGRREAFEEVGRHFNEMRDSLKNWAEENGWRSIGLNRAMKVLSDTDNIRTVAIGVEESYKENGKVEHYYTTEIIENLTPAYESKDHDKFQRDLRAINGMQFNSIGEAKSLLDVFVEKMNKMKIR